MDFYAIVMLAGCLGAGVFSGTVLPASLPVAARRAGGVGLAMWMAAVLVLLRAILRGLM